MNKLKKCKHLASDLVLISGLKS